MSDTIGRDCEAIRELIPDFVANRLSSAQLEGVEAHVHSCADCRAELELARLIFASRPHAPDAPDALVERITRAAAADRQAPARTWWGVSAAAIAARALGIGITSDPTPPTPVEVPAFAAETDEVEIWLSDDGLIAGAPALDDLSDEALQQLLDELSTDFSGGAA